MEQERIQFPDKLVGWYDIVKGLGEIALETITKQFLHEVPSDHFKDRGASEQIDRLLFDSEGDYHDRGSL